MQQSMTKRAFPGQDDEMQQSMAIIAPPPGIVYKDVAFFCFCRMIPSASLAGIPFSKTQAVSAPRFLKMSAFMLVLLLCRPVARF
jgi:hypothetical protein